MRERPLPAEDQAQRRAEQGQKCGLFLADHGNGQRLRDTTAKVWNNEHAQIEIVEGIDKTHIAEYFRDRAQQCDKWIERYTWDFGADSNSVKEQEQYKGFYNSVVARLEG